MSGTMVRRSGAIVSGDEAVKILSDSAVILTSSDMDHGETEEAQNGDGDVVGEMGHCHFHGCNRR